MDHLRCLRKLGCGAFSGQAWFQLKWVGQLQGHSITVKELISIVIAAAVWGPRWRGSSIQVLCDNAAVVAILNQNSSREKEVMHLVCCLAFIMAKFQFLLSASHIPGVQNTATDALSRNKLDIFHSIYPQANSSPAPLPAALLDVLLLSKPCRLDILELDRTVEQYFHQGLGPSTWRRYGSAQRRYLSFCTHYRSTPIPSSEQLLCQFAADLAASGLQASTIKCYLSANKTTSYCTGVGDPGMAKLEQVIIQGRRQRYGRYGHGRTGFLRKKNGVAWILT